MKASNTSKHQPHTCKVDKLRVVCTMNAKALISHTMAVPPWYVLREVKKSAHCQTILPASGMVSRYVLECLFKQWNLRTSWFLLATPLEMRRMHRLTGRCNVLKHSHDLPLCSTQASSSSREAALTSFCTRLFRQRISPLSKSEKCSSCGSRLSSVDRPHAISKSQTCSAK